MGIASREATASDLSQDSLGSFSEAADEGVRTQRREPYFISPSLLPR